MSKGKRKEKFEKGNAAKTRRWREDKKRDQVEGSNSRRVDK
jgi:hypothetical protein